MALVISSVIRRHLKHAAGYVQAGAEALPVEFDGKGETVVGWYRNPAPFESDYVLFTTTAIYTRSARGWDRVAFEDIVHYEVPKTKEESSGVRIRTRTGIGFIRFAGRSGPGGKFSDAFSLVGLLRVVVLANRRADAAPPR